MAENNDYFNRPKRRQAEFIQPPNVLKAKVGSGGLSEDILNMAQRLLEDNTVDFQPLAESYLSNLNKGIETAQKNKNKDKEEIISGILYPVMQLKANGGMFHYPLVTRISDRMIQFLEVIDKVDKGVIEIAQAFHTAIRAIVLGKITGDGGQSGQALLEAITDACNRYFEKRGR